MHDAPSRFDEHRSTARISDVIPPRGRSEERKLFCERDRPRIGGPRSAGSPPIGEPDSIRVAR